MKTFYEIARRFGKRTVVALAVLGIIGVGYVFYFPIRSRLETMPIDEQEKGLGPGNAQSNRVRVLIDTRDPVRGADAALVTLVQFCDFRSIACKRVARTLFESVLAHPREVRVVFKALPTSNDPDSITAAEAALAAHEQGKFWEMHDLLLSEPDRLDRARLEERAQRIGLDMPAFRASLDAHEHASTLEQAAAYAEKVGVRGGPALFINGLRIDDVGPSFVQLEPRIEAEIQRVQDLILEKDLSAQDVYREIMSAARPPASSE